MLGAQQSRSCALLGDFFGVLFPLLSPRCALQWSRCTGRSCGSGGRCLWPNLDSIPARCKQSPERGRKRLLEEKAWSAVPVLLPPTFHLPGARSKRHKFHLQLSRSSKCDWNAAATLPPELGWPWLLQHGHPWTLESPVCSLYPFFLNLLFLHAACFGIIRSQACAGWEFWTFLVSQSVRTDAGCLFHSFFFFWEMESTVPKFLLTTAALKMPAEHNNLEQFVSKYFLVPFKGACERSSLPAESQRGICSCF